MIRSLSIWLCCFSCITAEVVTLVDPYSPVPEDKTVVWSPIFQATWEAMNSKLGGKPKRIEPPNEFMARLDRFKWKKQAVMPESGWGVWAGEATSSFLKQVNEEAKKIGGEKPFRLSEAEGPGTIACFGLLNRNVEFEKEFYRSSKLALKFGQKKESVKFFGAKHDVVEGYGTSVKVIASRPVTGSHVLEISCKATDEKVILYLPSEPQDFATAIKWINFWRKNWKPGDTGKFDHGYLHEGDDVRIPYISLEAEADLSTILQSKRFYGKPGDPWTVRRAEQRTHFELFEKGASIRAEVSIEIDPFSEAPRLVPRNFFYDRPFFVFLWRDNAAWPYFGAWMGDTSALQAF
ncbi:MAG: hypothetical protein AB8D78_03420 [Akkermansiaceae bacterium]